MANVKITALESISSVTLAPEDVFVIDDVSVLITRKLTLSNLTRYLSSAIGVANVESNLDSYAAYANANAAALANAVTSNITLSNGTSASNFVLAGGVLTIAGSDDVRSTLAGSSYTLSLSNTGVSSGNYGGVSANTIIVPSFAVSPSGRVTAASNSSYTVDFSSVFNTIGNLNDLTTPVRDNIVSAINSIGGLQHHLVSDLEVRGVSSLGANIIVMPTSQHFAKLLVSVQDVTYNQFQTSELLLVHDNSSVKLVEYGISYTSTNPIASYNAAINQSNVILLATPNSANNTIRIYRITT